MYEHIKEYEGETEAAIIVETESETEAAPIVPSLKDSLDFVYGFELNNEPMFDTVVATASVETQTTCETPCEIPSKDPSLKELLYWIKKVAADVSVLKSDLSSKTTDLNTRLNAIENVTIGIDACLKRRVKRPSNNHTFTSPPSNLLPTPVIYSSSAPKTLPIVTSPIDTLQPPITPPQPPIASSHPSIASSQPTITSSQPSIASSQPTIASSQPLTPIRPEQTFAGLISSSLLMNTLTPDQILPPTNKQSSEELYDETKAKKASSCAAFIRQQLQSQYQEQELANGRVGGGKRKYKDTIQEKVALSPNRYSKILTAAKRRFSKEEFDGMGNVKEVVNSKCRQVRLKLDRRYKNL